LRRKAENKLQVIAVRVDPAIEQRLRSSNRCCPPGEASELTDLPRTTPYRDKTTLANDMWEFVKFALGVQLVKYCFTVATNVSMSARVTSMCVTKRDA
jgi:hypothetical protein